LLVDQLQHIAWLGDVRQVDLGLDFVGLGARCAGGLRRTLRFGSSAKMRAHLLRFMILNGTGVGFLFGDAHHRQYIENRLAFDFQLPGQIVNSNLAHPPSLVSSAYRLRVHFNLTAVEPLGSGSEFLVVSCVS